MEPASADIIRRILQTEATLLMQRDALRRSPEAQQPDLGIRIAALEQTVGDLRRQLHAIERGDSRRQ